MKPENLGHWTIHIRHLSDVPVSRNWYKTESKLYQNVYISDFVSRDQFTELPLVEVLVA